MDTFMFKKQVHRLGESLASSDCSSSPHSLTLSPPPPPHPSFPRVVQIGWDMASPEDKNLHS
jgi:hypothetical protein